MQGKITTEDIASVLVPQTSMEAELVAAMQAARARRAAQRQAADAELAGIDAFLLEQLGLTPPPSDTRTVFALRLKDFRDSRMDVLSHRPIYSDNYMPSVALVPLKDIAFIDSNVAAPPADSSDLVPYVGLPECSQTEVQEVVTRPYREVKGRSIVKPGNILFARIEPSVFNKKYVLADDLKGHTFAYTSTEFYVVEPDTHKVNPYYLYSLFFCSFVFAQTRGKTTGSSGRRRLDPAMFANLQIPLPPRELQDTIAQELHQRQETAKELRAAAEAEWEAAKAEFERRLLGAESAD